jgi:predicted RNA-binding protein
MIYKQSVTINMKRIRRSLVFRHKKRGSCAGDFARVDAIIAYPNSTTKTNMQTPRNEALITQTTILTPTCEDKMCEFNVILNGKTQFKDAVGETKEFKNCKITEVDVNSTRLVLTAIKP